MQTNDPNLNHLRYFLTAVQLGSHAKAAKFHRVSQPAISLAINKLEESFNVTLVMNLKNRFKLTPEGEKLVAEAPRLMKALEDLRVSLQSETDTISGELNLVSSMGVAPFYLIRPLKEFTTKYEAVNFHINLGDVKNIFDQVQSNQAELGIFMEDETKIPFPKRILTEGNFVAIASRSAGDLDLKQKVKILITKEAPGVYEFESIVKKKMKQAQFHYHTVESWELIVEMAINGLGVGIVPEFMLENIKDKCTVQTELTHTIRPMNYKISVIHKGEHQLSKEAKLFLDSLN